MIFLMFSDFWVELLRLTNKLMKLDPTVLFFASPDLREHDDGDDDDDDDDDDDATCWRCDALDGMGKGKKDAQILCHLCFHSFFFEVLDFLMLFGGSSCFLISGWSC